MPRIGPRRELKLALESYWSGASDEEALLEAAAGLRAANWARQKAARRHRHPVERFLALRSRARHQRHGRRDSRRSTAGKAARCRSRPISRWRAARKAKRTRSSLRATVIDHGHGVPAQEMTKWFDTNYHYMVPEFAQRPDLRARLAQGRSTNIARPRRSGYQTRPVLLGPVTYLKLGKSKRRRLRSAVAARPAAAGLYRCAAQLAASGAEWVQIDEPCLVLDLDDATREALRRAYASIRRGAADAEDHADDLFRRARRQSRYRAVAAGRGLHLDLVRAPRTARRHRGKGAGRIWSCRSA